MSYNKIKIIIHVLNVKQKILNGLAFLLESFYAWIVQGNIDLMVLMYHLLDQ